MNHKSFEEFDIDVDISPLLGTVASPSLIDDCYYRMAHREGLRDPRLRTKAGRILDNAIFRAQWAATRRRALERRRALRVPLLSRVRIDGGEHMVSTDISLSGMRCSGEPASPLMDVEFKVPGLQFPIDARVEVMSFKDANVIPLVGLRFVDIEEPYIEEIARYIGRRRSRELLAA